ncbi:MAG: cyclase family protein [Parvibaculaceae bacterium]
MAKLIDLSIPVRHGDGRLGLKVEFSTPYSYENCNWQGSCVSMFCHHATHVDAPNHFLEGTKGIDEAPLERLIGAAALMQLDDHGREAAITGDTLEERGRHVRKGDIVILRTGWSDKHWGTDAFWREGPYLDLSGADWLVRRGAKAVVYDFSEEYVVRKPGFRGEECLIHHRILGQEIYNIEYVHKLGQITQPRLTILAMPLKLVGLDGSPARVIAIEEANLPDQFDVVR